jgi:hypothetical protein
LVLLVEFLSDDVHELTRRASSPGGFHAQRLRVRINCTPLSLQGYHAIHPVLLYLLGEFSVCGVRRAHDIAHQAGRGRCEDGTAAASDRFDSTTWFAERITYNPSMDYQLVIKFWRKSLASEEFLATIESELKEVLGKTVELEGYDVTPKEINLFMLTADPRHSFRRARDVLEKSGVTNGVSAAFRLVGGAKFTSIWPLRTTRKFSLPSAG